jgi:hypothetical protein
MTTSNDKPGCFGMLLRALGIRPSEQEADIAGPLPYRLRDDFLSSSELSFYHVLALAVARRAIICPKVGLGDVFYVSRPNENFAYFNKIRQRHVDFLLCDPATMRPLAGIELDDTSHNRRDRQESDAFEDSVFQAAGLPLLRFPARANYVVSEIVAQLGPVFQPEPAAAMTPDGTSDSEPDPRLDPASQPQPPHVDTGTATDGAPLCPRCGVPMVLRTATRGSRVGQPFYGCSNYPRCHETLPCDQPPA